MRDINGHTVYVFVRQNISIQQQFVQGIHGAYKAPKGIGDHGDPKVCVVGMPDIKALQRVLKKLHEHGISRHAWFEPDHCEVRDLTAIVTEPVIGEKKDALANYRLWQPGVVALEPE
jgi:hypothetical protein